MKLICDYCGKTVDKNGVIHKGKTYHHLCFSNSSFITTLHREFSDISRDIIEDLFRPDIPNTARAKLLAEKIKAKWCVIVILDENGYDIHQFNTKKSMVEWLTQEVITALVDGYSFEVVYVLNNGELIKDPDTVEVKIRLI